MGARILPLASIFVFDFCLTTGCGLSRGTPADHSNLRSRANDPPPEYEEIEVGGNRPVASLAGIAGIEAQRSESLNPELLQGYTPPGENRFRVKLPIGNGAIAELLGPEERQPERQTPRATLVVHEVRRGETLFSIARRYGQEARMLMELNSLQSSTLRVGQKLKVMLQSLHGTLR
jgi:LysM repeat protein